MPLITDKLGKASIDTNYAIATTVKTTRTAGVTVLEANDLSKFNPDTPVYFITYKKTTDPVTGTVSVTNLISWKALVNTGANTLTNLTLAPGYADTGNAIGDFIECIPTSYWENSLIDALLVGMNLDGTFKKSALVAALGNDGLLVQSLDDLTRDFTVTGGVWSLVSGLNGQMTAFTGYIDGYKNTIAAVASRAYTLSKDTYVDVLRNTSTNVFTLVYTEVANGAAAPALAANSMRLAKVVTSGVAITGVTQFSSDSLGNTYRPRGGIGAVDIQNGVKFGAWRNAAMVVGTGAYYPAYDVVEFNHGNCYNPANGRFTAPFDGYYQFNFGSILAAPAMGATYMGFDKNGAEIKRTQEQPSVPSGNNTFSGSAFLELKAGDYVNVRLSPATAVNAVVGNAAYNWFNGFLVSKD